MGYGNPHKGESHCVVSLAVDCTYINVKWLSRGGMAEIQYLQSPTASLV